MNKSIQILAIGSLVILIASVGGIITPPQQQQLVFATKDPETGNNINEEEEEESSSSEGGEEQSGDYFIKEIEGQTYRVYPDGKHVNTETGSCFYVNPEAGTTYGFKTCDSKNLEPGGGVAVS